MVDSENEEIILNTIKPGLISFIGGKLATPTTRTMKKINRTVVHSYL